MPDPQKRALFVTGTDTDAGKTLCATWLCLQGPFDYWKPFQTGVATDTADGDRVAHLLGDTAPQRVFPSSFVFQAPASPADAATQEGTTVDLATVEWPCSKRGLVVEGAGGALVPLNDRTLLIDWVAEHALPVLLVVGSKLGAINHALLTLEALKHRHLEVVGVVMCGKPYRGCTAAIERFGHVPVLQHLPWFESVTTEALLACEPSPTMKELFSRF